MTPRETESAEALARRAHTRLLNFYCAHTEYPDFRKCRECWYAQMAEILREVQQAEEARLAPALAERDARIAELEGALRDALRGRLGVVEAALAESRTRLMDAIHEHAIDVGDMCDTIEACDKDLAESRAEVEPVREENQRLRILNAQLLAEDMEWVEAQEQADQEYGAMMARVRALTGETVEQVIETTFSQAKPYKRRLAAAEEENRKLREAAEKARALLEQMPWAYHPWIILDNVLKLAPTPAPEPPAFPCLRCGVDHTRSGCPNNPEGNGEERPYRYCQDRNCRFSMEPHTHQPEPPPVAPSEEPSE